MNQKELFREVGGIDDDLIEAAANAGRNAGRRRPMARMAMLAAVLCLLICASITVWAVSGIKQTEAELYIRYLTPQMMELDWERDETFQADRFFDALEGEDLSCRYVAINRLVECYNDDALRQKAIAKITPFLKDENKKIAQAAEFSLDILTETFQSDRLCRLQDGSRVFVLFYEYSDYGSDRDIWRIADGRLEKYFTFDAPSMYIAELLPSPDSGLLAVRTRSNKSEYVTILDIPNGMISPELMDSARVMHGTQTGNTVWQRIDYENYSGAQNLRWEENDTLVFDASLAYDGGETVDEAVVRYRFRSKTLEVLPKP